MTLFRIFVNSEQEHESLSVDPLMRWSVVEVPGLRRVPGGRFSCHSATT